MAISGFRFNICVINKGHTQKLSTENRGTMIDQFILMFTNNAAFNLNRNYFITKQYI